MNNQNIDYFARLDQNKNSGRWPNESLNKSPYKPLLLLAILDLFDQGRVKNNLIELTDELEKLFIEYCSLILSPDNKHNISMPFYHLRSEGFWNLVPKTDDEVQNGSGATKISPSNLRKTIVGAQFDPNLFDLLVDDTQRKNLRSKLISESYFDLETQQTLMKQSNINQAASTERSFWWVNQGSTYKLGRENRFIWAPKKNRANNSVFHWDNVSQVKAGHIIFHYSDKFLRALSIAASDAYEAENESDNDPWNKLGWKVDSDYIEFTDPIAIEEIGTVIAHLNLEYGPINRNGGVNQGYLFKISMEAASFLLSKVSDDPALKDLEFGDILGEETFQIDIGLTTLCESLNISLNDAAIQTAPNQLTRFVSAILSKRFMILTGLSGSGKTKLAQAFSHWLVPQSSNTTLSCSILVPVGADWIGNENLLGYPNGLEPGTYVSQPALELILRAIDNPSVPHFLILDEMNLSHVERYFADFLSAIESGEGIPLYSGEFRTSNGQKVPQILHLPDNLFVIGTVNVDETTYMFSPKVLDRANVIEFRMDESDLERFLDAPNAPDLEALAGLGQSFGLEFVRLASDKQIQIPDEIQDKYKKEMLLFFNLLQQHNAEFGYRVGYEAARFIYFYKLLGGYADDKTDWFDDAMDAVIVQKLLPKLHGSRTKLEGLLWGLAWACGAERGDETTNDIVFAKQVLEASRAQDDKYNPERLENSVVGKTVRYKLSFDKVMRMWRKLVRDQFVTFAEA